MTDPSFPPLLSGHPVDGSVDPFEKACAMAALGCDGGTIVYGRAADRLRAAMVMAPEVPLEDAVVMLPTCGIGFQNALGVLAPPEVAVHLDWDGGIRVNGASCGRLRMAAAGSDAKAVSEWLVVGLELRLWPDSDDMGKTPDRTALYAEGCADVDPAELLESWARHSLVWINRWSDDGVKPLHSEWRGLAHGIGEDATVFGQSGTFVGVDEKFGMLLRDDDTTHLLPLTGLLEGSQ